MKNVNFKIQLALFALAQLSMISCNREDTIIENTQITKDNNTAYKSIYAGPATDLITEKLPSRVSRSATDLNCLQESVNQKKTYGDFVTFGSGTNLMWPGNLVQGNSIKTGNLAPIPIDGSGRNSIEIKIDAFSANPQSSSQLIDSPTPGKVQNALGQILDGYYSSGTKFPANYSITVQRAYSKNQLQLALNAGYSGLEGVNVGAQFAIDFKENRNYFAVTLRQEFFTASVTPKSKLQDDFGWIKKDYPQTAFNQYISANNPSTYISTVTYGRLYTIIYESEESALDLEQALNFAYNSPSTSVTAEQKLKYAKTLQNSKTEVKQLGGSSTDGLATAFQNKAGDFDSIQKFIVNGAEVSKTNPGYPIAYTAVDTETSEKVTFEYSITSKYMDCKKVEIPYTANSYDDAKNEVNKLKSEYGTGNSAKIIIYNDTTKDIVLKSETPWYGSSFYNSAPSKIPAGKYGYILGVHQTGAATGTFNQLSYLLDDQVVSFGTYAPWSSAKTNNVLVNFGEITEQQLYSNSTNPFIAKNQGNIRITGRIESQSSPIVSFTVKQ